MHRILTEQCKAVVPVGAILFVGVACMHLLAYRNVIPDPWTSMRQAPATFGYVLRTTMPQRPSASHPMLAAWRTSSGEARTEDIQVPYQRPMALALRALGRSLAAVAAALVLIIAFSIVRATIAVGTVHRRLAGAWLWAIRGPDEVLQRLQRLPGLVVYFLLVFLLGALGVKTGNDVVVMALLLSLILANSDGVVPDLSDLIAHRYCDLAQRDYVKAGRLEGRGLLPLMARDLTMTGVDWLGGRLLQVLSGAFLLELLLRYPGIGRQCVVNLFSTTDRSGTLGTVIAKSDELYAVLLLMLAVAMLVIVARRSVVRILDPRPRTVVAQ